MVRRFAVLLWGVALLARPVAAQDTVVIGAKNFTESALLGEIMAQIIEAETDLRVERRFRLGGTMICWTALRTGEIDIYAEYTGTAWAEILNEREPTTDPLLAFLRVQERSREEHDVRVLAPFGLQNSYALALTEARAEELGVRTISDLRRHQGRLKAGFSIEFGNRDDGYPGLAAVYGLDLDPATVEHGLAYEAIQSGRIDLIDVYSTDAKLLRYKLRVLEDDRRFFPPYNAAPFLYGGLLQRHPKVRSALARLAYRIPDYKAQVLNYTAESGHSVADVARAFLESEGLVNGERENAAAAKAAYLEALATRPKPGSILGRRPGFADLLVERSGQLLTLLLEHLGLTLAAVFLAACVAIPLGVYIVERAAARQLALGIAGVFQTVPSLALLAFMIPVFGLGVESAIAALFVYALLPILRNTCTGIAGVDRDLIDAARGMGMRPREVLMRVQLPLALRTIMAGVRTATVISVGVATLAAFIGVGGLGEPIVEGLYLNDVGLILFGGIPAALLAVVADLGLGRIERALAPRGVR